MADVAATLTETEETSRRTRHDIMTPSEKEVKTEGLYRLGLMSRVETAELIENWGQVSGRG